MDNETIEKPSASDTMNSLVRCALCAFWGKNDEQDWLSVDGAKFCAHPTVANAYEQKTIKQNSVVCFYEGGCTGELCTMPDFGCVNFSPNRCIYQKK